MEIRVIDFVELCIDSDSLVIKMFSISAGDYIFEGLLEDMPTFLENKFMLSYDLPEQGCITINID